MSFLEAAKARILSFILEYSESKSYKNGPAEDKIVIKFWIDTER